MFRRNAAKLCSAFLQSVSIDRLLIQAPYEPLGDWFGQRTVYGSMNTQIGPRPTCVSF